MVIERAVNPNDEVRAIEVRARAVAAERGISLVEARRLVEAMIAERAR